jgi:hypothetical protein
MRRLLPLLLVLALPGTLSAQHRLGTWLDWGTVEVLLYPSSDHGLQVSFWTTGQAGVQRGRGVAGGFEPESVFAWINAADRVIHPVARPSGPTVVLATPALRSASGDSIQMFRRAKGGRWEDRVIVALDERGNGADHFAIRARPAETTALIEGMLREAGLSGYDKDSVAASVARTDSLPMLQGRVDTPPALVEAGPQSYPDQSIRGRVLLEYFVREDGTVEASSIHAIIADDDRLVDPARTMVAASRFTSALLNGRPVGITVRQAVNFIP